MKTNRLGWAVIAAALSMVAGCNGTVVSENGAGGDGAGGSDTGGETSTADTTTSSTLCVEQPTDWDNLPPQNCETLTSLIVANPALTDDSGDGSVSPGETATLAVDLVETSGYGMFSYPLIHFTTDNPAVTASNEAMLYGIGGCGVFTLNTLITVSASIPKGTKINVYAQVGALNLDCPDAFTLTVPVQIQ